MTPSQYTECYAGMWTWIVDSDGEPTYRAAPIRNYLQNNVDSSATRDQALRASAAWGELQKAIVKRLGGQPKATFTIGEDTYFLLSLQRAFWGKGAPSEIQDALWLATSLGVVKAAGVTSYCLDCLGVDCGGFVANYWGFGKPSPQQLKPAGSEGMLPRQFWGEAGSRRRARPDQIRQGDAVIFFEGKVFNNDPSTLAPKNANGSFDTSKGTKAFHIGLVADVSATPTSVAQLQIAESSGSRSIYGGSGVNVRNAVIQGTTVAGGLVGCALSDAERIYFVGPRDGRISPYLSQFGD